MEEMMKALRRLPTINVEVFTPEIHRHFSFLPLPGPFKVKDQHGMLALIFPTEFSKGNIVVWGDSKLYITGPVISAERGGHIAEVLKDAIARTDIQTVLLPLLKRDKVRMQDYQVVDTY